LKNIKYFVICAGICYLLMIIFSFISSAIFAYTDINDNKINFFVYGIISLSIFISSIILNKKIKEKGLLYGSLFGLLIYVLIYLIISIFITGFNFNFEMLLYIAIAIVSGLIGGVLGVNI
jgi:putative membrane protein (TIGR04086 family)